MYKKCTCKGLAFGRRYYKNMITLTIRNEDNSFLGLIKYYIPKKNHNICWIQMLIIPDKYIGKGLGQKIFNEFQNKIKIKYNIEQFYLAVIMNNEKARKFWRKMGFQMCDIIKINDSVKGIKSNILLIYNKPLCPKKGKVILNGR